tara:strand:+ start:179 stop:454 length:276 start_codon:yes stop_codon:yes gene_type:complete
MIKDTEIFTCSCMTLNCNCRKNFTSQSTSFTSTNPVTTTSEMYINGEKVTKDNSVKVIFNKLKSRQRKMDVQNAMKQKKLLKKANKNWVLN